tara:strand:- start:1431 stop:2696 length:1266 start_codon:yes stop_codon:yes gene_type:complete
MKKDHLKKIIIILVWIATLIFASLWSYENPENIESIKLYFKTTKAPKIKKETELLKEVKANSFSVEYTKVISLSEKTAFIVSDENFSQFNGNKLKIYTQNGYIINNLKTKELNLPKSFTLNKNGGVKTVFSHKNKSFALISALKEKCYYASIISLENGTEIFNTKCLPENSDKIDFNGMGSSNIHSQNKIYLAVGTPTHNSSKISALAQDNNSMFGKILAIDKKKLEQFDKNQNDKLSLEIFTTGHRTPQGLTRINNNFFNTEHGPKGGDELNKIIKNKNYGWPQVSYGTRYLYDDKGESYKVNHENYNFEEPLFALVPSVGLSSLNVCPKKLINYYNKSCLIALSLYGNDLRPGRSLIIYLLSKDMSSVHSVEQVHLDQSLKLRHFVTNHKNELYEDEDGNIYVSADYVGIYKINFTNFR